MVRLLLFLLGTLTTGRPGRHETAGYRAADTGVRTEPDVEYPRPDRYGGGGAWQDQPAPVAPGPPGTIGGGDPQRGLIKGGPLAPTPGLATDEAGASGAGFGILGSRGNACCSLE